MRNLLVRPAASQQGEDFMFAGRQARNQGTQDSYLTTPFTHFVGVQKSAFNSLQQSRFRYGLVRKSSAPDLIVCTLVGISPSPVTKMIGNSLPSPVR